jgi:uncharacterized protein YecE (DUF72 family)
MDRATQRAAPIPINEEPLEKSQRLEHEDRLARATALASRAPAPARLGRVRAGTAGWTDPSLSKSQRFYPRGVSSAEERLKFYSSQFSLVEVDSSYYALPSPLNARRWVERTANDFIFNVKAYAPLTQHPMEPSRLPSGIRRVLPDELLEKPRLYPKDLPNEVMDAIWEQFKRALDPLQEAHKLGCVLLQFPPWFTATRGNARVIEDCRERLSRYPVAIEFRHASWGAPERLVRVIDFLRALGAAYVVVDEPQGKASSMPPAVLVADPRLAVVRFHGRRTETWDVHASVAEKFDYLYDPAELEPWAPNVARLAGEAEQVHVVFNNCVQNYAVLGAKGLVALLARSEDAAA